MEKYFVAAWVFLVVVFILGILVRYVLRNLKIHPVPVVKAVMYFIASIIGATLAGAAFVITQDMTEVFVPAQIVFMAKTDNGTFVAVDSVGSQRVLYHTAGRGTYVPKDDTLLNYPRFTYAVGYRMFHTYLNGTEIFARFQFGGRPQDGVDFYAHYVSKGGSQNVDACRDEYINRVGRYLSRVPELTAGCTDWLDGSQSIRLAAAMDSTLRASDIGMHGVQLVYAGFVNP